MTDHLDEGKISVTFQGGSMKVSLIFVLLALLGLGVSCNRDTENNGREAMEEMEHEADEAGDKIEDTAEDVTD